MASSLGRLLCVFIQLIWGHHLAPLGIGIDWPRISTKTTRVSFIFYFPILSPLLFELSSLQ